MLSKQNPTDKRILNILKGQGPQTRTQLVQKTSIPRSTLYDALMRLIIKNEVSHFSERPNGRPGRPKVFFRVTMKSELSIVGTIDFYNDA